MLAKLQIFNILGDVIHDLNDKTLLILRAAVDGKEDVAAAQARGRRRRTRIDAVDEHAGVERQGIEMLQVLEGARDDSDVAAGDAAVRQKFVDHAAREQSGRDAAPRRGVVPSTGRPACAWARRLRGGGLGPLAAGQ